MKHFLGLLVAGFLLAGCSENNKGGSEESGSGIDLSVAGEQIFRDNCSGCHPRGGRGDYLQKIPATFLVNQSGYELINWIQGRDQHREMPSFTHLTEDELDALVVYLKKEINR
ncbi:MAG: cytochrome c [bacterium]